MKKCLMVVILAAAAMLFAVMPALAQDEQAVEAPTDSQFSYGTVLSVSGSSIKLSEYDFETDTSAEVVYDVAADAKFENVNSIADIKEGDEVEIEYVLAGNKRAVVSIYVE